MNDNNICSQCFINLKKLTYEIIVANDVRNVSCEISDDEDIFDLIDSSSEKLCSNEKLQVPDLNSRLNDKDALLASLCSQVTFLRIEIEEENLIIRTLMSRESELYRKLVRTNREPCYDNRNKTWSKRSSSQSPLNNSLYTLDEIADESLNNSLYTLDEIADESLNNYLYTLDEIADESLNNSLYTLDEIIDESNSVSIQPEAQLMEMMKKLMNIFEIYTSILRNSKKKMKLNLNEKYVAN